MKGFSLKKFFLFALFVFFIQNFALTSQIPPELQNLSYGIYQSNPAVYNTQRFNYNKRFNVFPLAIFVPSTQSDIAYVLSVLKQYNLPFAIRSGGHCYEPGSLSSSYIIDLQNFNTIDPNYSTSQVYIGAGVRLGDVINTLGANNYAIPVGTCPTNCITGFTLGGGIGLLSRLYGLGCDSVQSITFLNANSEVMEVNESSDPDLFWALRGGGNGSYGIALGFTYNMYYIPTVSYYDLKWEWDPTTFPNIFKAWQKWVLTLPDNISTIFRLSYESGKVLFNIVGLKVGSEPFTEWERPFKKFDPEVFITQDTFLATSKYWANQSPLPFNKGKSKIMMKPLSNKVINKIVDYITLLQTDNAQLTLFFDLEAYGGAIPKFHTAFFPRKAFGWWYQALYWSQQNQTEQALAYSRNFYSSIAPDVSIYSYANTVDYDIGPYYLNAYYGDHADRLIRIKKRIDPGNLFNWQQSIPLTKPVPGSLICQ